MGLIEMYSKSVFQEPGGALTYRAREVCTPVPFHRVPVHSEKQMGEMVRDSACEELINKNLHLSLLTSGASPLKEAEAFCSHHLLQTLSLIDVAALCPNHLNKRKTSI